MANLTIQKAKEYIELGVIRAVELQRVPMGDGWNIAFTGPGGKVDSGFLAERRNLQPRVFKSLDTAIGVLQELGIKVTALRPV